MITYESQNERPNTTNTVLTTSVFVVATIQQLGWYETVEKKTMNKKLIHHIPGGQKSKQKRNARRKSVTHPPLNRVHFLLYFYLANKYNLFFNAMWKKTH